MRQRSVVLLSSVAGVVLALPAAAQTTVSSSTSTPIATATAAGGSPSDVIIGSGVTLSPPSGTAVTINSNNSATNNGTITFTGVDNTVGIGASTGLAGSITNGGTITVSETSTAVDENGDGYIDGPFATGVNRYGVHVAGAGTFTGSITNTGTITVVGNNSAGIAVDDTLAGSLNSSGTISVSGANSYGIHTGAVTGDVITSGTITATGQGAVGIALDSDEGGTVTVGGSVTATGYRGGATAYATPVADDLYIGGPAVRIAGNVAGGVSLASTSAVVSYGSAPALLIGSSANSIAVQPISGSTYGLLLAGTVTGSGVNLNVDGTAVTIGGQGGAATTIVGGISLTGTVSAAANQSNATGLVLAAGAATPVLAVTGTLTATGGAGVYAATGLVVQAGASLPSIANTGTISAISNGSTGTATAIRDQSGTLVSIANSGTIKASLTGSYAPAQATAIDLSANTTGVTITNVLASSTSTVTPFITGAVLTGSGNDVFNVSAGVVTGAISMGGGANTLTVSGIGQVIGAVDLSGGAGTLALSGKGTLTGDASFGAGSTMSLADTSSFTGSIVQNGNAVALSLGGTSSFNTANAGAIALSSLSIASGATFRVNIDPTAGTATSYVVAGAANIASGATIALNIDHFLPATQSYAIVSAGSLTGGTGLSVLSTSLPYIYTAATAASTAAGTVTLTLQPKTASQLGLNRSGTAAYGAIYAAVPTDGTVESAFLAVSNDAQFQKLYSEMLPEHGGGMFLSTSMVSQAVSDFEAQAAAPRATSGRLGLWIMQVGSLLDKGQGDTQAFHLSNYGLGIGAEYGLGAFGTVGLAYDWSYNRITDPADANELNGDMSEVGGYWRGAWAGLRLHAHGAWGHVSQSSLRELFSPTSSTTILETARATWGGSTLAAGGGGSYEVKAGRFLIRPAASVDYFRLNDDAHTETGGGTAYDLAIAQRLNKAVTGTYTLTAGYRISHSDDVDSRIELELGDRQKLSGSLADTVATFSGGQAFTLQADTLRYGPLAKLRVAIGTDTLALIGELKAQKTQGTTAAGVSVGLQVHL